jgi:Iron-containing redox enzyme
MTPIYPIPQTLNQPQADSLKLQLSRVAEDLIASLPAPEQLSAEGRRGIIARYSAVLEGNFIYWMTGAYLAAKTQEARSIIQDNLLEEVRDCHPGMLRRFALAAGAIPDELDALAIYPQLTDVRLFIGRLSPAPLIAMMAFFEDFIQRFMGYLAELARQQGSEEQEYTQVHGFCDIAHSQELFHALEGEMDLAFDSREPTEALFEGVYLLRTLIQGIIANPVYSSPLREYGRFPNVN